MLRTIIGKIPGYARLRFRQLGGSQGYWERRYQNGGNSGAGSYGEAAEYKARFLNDFVTQNDIRTVIELGCGDGNQLSLARYPEYLGLDVSPKALEVCKLKFAADLSKRFELYPGDGSTADLALSLDVLYHLVELPAFEEYLHRLFAAATRYVVIYAYDEDRNESAHVLFRKFTPYIAEHFPHFRLVQSIPAPDPQFAEFRVYAKQTGPF